MLCPSDKLFIKDIEAGSEISGLFLLAAASKLQARNGMFWRLELKDATGSLESRIWSPLSQQYLELPVGQIVEIEGRAELFRDQLQLSLSKIRALSSEEQSELHLGDYMPASKIAPALMFQDLEKLCKQEIQHKSLRKFINLLLNDEDVHSRLLQAPAAKSVHHAWVGGLLEHILGVSRLCVSFSKLYPELDGQLLLAGAVCHDLGKLWELSGGLNNEYTTLGKLIGHINIGLEKIEAFIKKAGLEEDLALHLKHLVLSHHGEYEYGSPRLPQTAEAFALHYADNLDAKLNQCKNLFDESAYGEVNEEGLAGSGAWSNYQGTLKREVYLPPRAISSVSGAEADKKKRNSGEGQCSLL